MKNFVLGMLTAVVLLFIMGFGYLRMGLAEVRGDVPSSRFEDYLMRAAVHASVRRAAPNLPNPVPPTDENLIAGGKQFLSECAGCHGTPGKARKISAGLNPPVPQLPAVGTEYTEAQIFWVAKHGIRRSGMFSNGLWDSDEELWRLATFIKHIKDLPPRVREELAKENKSVD
ncbi:MAG: c-type cytochrome [Terriglobales bacterium]